ncbi:PFU-domain-containing protein [Jaminaea rosea]|uniref:PFU-domain-containing protein n=1 Tax=Jaminaea rosea TaxID=1569628 RepID=A0A316UQZ9_9BASI|nr:PFU-domain-containing protein [Jaminaea rosea]PWN27737.1 PFU-domain-containing protein [Jaminaea rosea]
MASSSAYKLSNQLQGHQGDVRAVATHSHSSGSSLVISASRDKTASVWTRRAGGRNFEPPETLPGHGGYVNSCAWLSDGADGLFALTGGQDKLVNAYQVKVGGDGRAIPSISADFTLVGHEDNVSTLDVGPGGSYVVSGSWDKTARVWKNWQCVATLKGHLQAVWAVVAVDSDRILTASADKLVRLWSISRPQEPIAVFAGHSDAVRGLHLLPGEGSFASCSNDGNINVWSISSPHRPMQVLSGHTSFVYSLTALPTGELVSSGEDRSVRIWREGSLVQTLTVPAISVWTVAALSDGDVVCGSSDNFIHIFTRDASRVAEAGEIEAYDRSVSSQALNKTQVGDIRKDQVPGKEALNKAGTREGETKMVSASGGVIEAYQWSTASSSWEKVGEVVGGVGSGTKKLYEGKEYDYVFDVDIADDAPPLKLPYNLSENAYMAAQRFLERNELPMSYLEQVVGFIDKNTEGQTLGVGQDTSTYVDPYSGTGRYIPPPAGGAGGSNGAAQPGAAAATKALAILPVREAQSFKQANLPALEGKLKELSATHSGGSVDATQTVAQLTAALQAGAAATPIDLSPILSGLESWPSSARFPLLDLVRLACLFPTTPAANELLPLILSASGWHAASWPSTDSKAAETNTMLCARALANAFSSSTATGGSALLSSSTGAADLQPLLACPHFAHLSKPGRVAFATVLLNLSTNLVSGSNAIDSSALLEAINRLLTEEPGDDEVVYRTLIAQGNVLFAAGEGKKSGKPVTLPVGAVQLGGDAAQAWGQRLGGGSPRIKEVLEEITEVGKRL